MLLVRAFDLLPTEAVPLFTGLSAGRPHAEGADSPVVTDLADLVGAIHRDSFFARVDGTSMTGAGIYPGDVVVVDFRREARSGDVVVAVVDGQTTLKRYVERGTNGETRRVLLPEGEGEDPILLGRAAEAELLGVVTWTLKPHRSGRP
ncbi:MAG: S24 family peptidase [Bacteroidota bacterium]